MGCVGVLGLLGREWAARGKKKRRGKKEREGGLGWD